MNRLLPLLLTALLLPLAGLQAQTHITDFVYEEGDKSSNPAKFIQLNDLLLFEATTGAQGRELWVSGGSGENTRILKDINPGAGSGAGQSTGQDAVILGGQLFFIADDGENGTQVWSTGGTEQTTKRVTNIQGLNLSKLTLVGNHIFFLSNSDGVLQVWKSDGTAKGTVMVKGDLPIWNRPTFEGAANGLFFFTFQTEGSSNSRLWRSDGSEKGTFPVTGEIEVNRIGPFYGPSVFSSYISFKDELYFLVRGSGHFPDSAFGLMKSDGTVANTVPVNAVSQSHTSRIDLVDVIEANGKLYFSLFEAYRKKLYVWETDGTSTGTVKVYDESSPDYFTTSNLSTDGEYLVFIGKGKSGGTALLKLKLDDHAIEQVKDLAEYVTVPYSFSLQAAYQISRVSDSRFLLFEPSVTTVGGWVTGLTEASTIPVSHLKHVTEAAVLGRGVFFAGSTSKNGTELWKADFAFSDPQEVFNINKSPFGYSDNAYSAAVLGGKTFFSSYDADHGFELWVYDCATGEKSLVRDLRAGSDSSRPNNLVVFNGHVYFTAQTGEHGVNLWRSDGTAEGTVPAGDLEGGTNIGKLTESNGKLFFVNQLENRYVLCRTDGANTEVVRELGVDQRGVPFILMQMVSAGDFVYFTTYADGEELWKTDGTESGTIKLKDLQFIHQLTAMNDKVFFAASEPGRGIFEMWHSDGSVEGTAKVAELGVDFTYSPNNLFAFDGRIVFTAHTKEHGQEYWITDGTPEGTGPIADINPGAGNSVTGAAHYALFDGTLYFSANDGTHGTELWKTDGTPAGTELVRDINKGASGSFPKYLIADAERLYFSAYTAASGTESWTSVGTASSTRQLFNIAPGGQSSNPSHFFFCGEELLFLAETVPAGRQLWSADQGEVTAVDEPYEERVFTLYPNPTTDYIHLGHAVKAVKATGIVNMKGQHISVSQDKSDRIYVGDLTPGLYMLVTEVDKKVVVRKFLKR